MKMETTTLITLAWELHTQGLTKSCIAERLGKDRGTVRLWLEAVTEQGLLPFLEQHQKAKKQPRPARQVRLSTKQLVWAIREREHGCCGQKIAYFLDKEHQISLSVPKIYEVLAEKYTLRSKWAKNQKRGEVPQAEAARQVIQRGRSFRWTRSISGRSLPLPPWTSSAAKRTFCCARAC